MPGHHTLRRRTRKRGHCRRYASQFAGSVVTFCEFAAQFEQKIMILRLLIGAVIGGGLGFAYYKFVGCSSGACPLTSQPVISTIYGMVVGVLVTGGFK
jgi:hypothetical protein